MHIATRLTALLLSFCTDLAPQFNARLKRRPAELFKINSLFLALILQSH
jgi:hypothetical protein